MTSTQASASAAMQYRYRFGSVEFDEARCELRVNGLAVDVQQKPLQLLALLLARPGQLVGKDEIYAQLWGDRVTVENVMANAVSKLRAALGEGNADRIATVPRQGYRFDGALERVAVGHQTVTQLDLRAGMPVPTRENFLLQSQFGQSHSSETWLARHAKTGEQRVYKFCLDAERLSLLKREVTVYRVLRETLGERDDFARVLDWNFETAPYFLECEYGGVQLAEWATEPAGVGSPATRLAAMAPPERLALFLQAADAVAAAHSVGVLHKDIKPANMLVARRRVADAERETWQLRLADFGSARLSDPHRLEALRITQLGMTLEQGAASAGTGGTAFYLAPEVVAGGAPSVRSDLYALGVVLYQLLVGDLRRVMAPGWERDIADPVLCEDIALATDMDPARRLASVAELAERLRGREARQQMREAQAAAHMRVQAAEQALARSAARRPWVVAAMGVLALGLGVSLWLYAAERRAAAALAQQHELVQSLNRLLTEDMIGAANPAASGRSDITVADALKNAAAHIDTKFAGQSPAVQGGLHVAMQRALSELSRVQDAVAQGQAALKAFARAGVPDRAAMQDVRVRLAVDLVQLSRLDEASVLIKDAERDAGPAAAQLPEFRARLLYAKSWLTSGDMSLKESHAQLSEAWVLVQPMSNLQAPWREKIAFALGDSYSMLGEHAQGEKLYRQLLQEQRAQYGADSARPLVTLVGLGSNLSYQKRYAEAIAVLGEAAQGLTAKLGPTHRMTLSAYDMLASVYFNQGDFAHAIAEWQRVLPGFTAMLGETSSYAITVETNLGIARHHAGHPVEAEPVLRSALAHVRAIVKDDSPQAQQVRYALADCLLDLHRNDEAATLLQGLSAAALNTAQPEPDWDARLAYQRARLALAHGERAQALALLQQAAPALASRQTYEHLNEQVVRKLMRTLGS